MTREEKINTLKAIIQECEEYQRQRKETLFEIIKDLEQEPILEQIRAEIKRLPITDTAVRLVTEILDKYKVVESKEQKMAKKTTNNNQKEAKAAYVDAKISPVTGFIFPVFKCPDCKTRLYFEEDDDICYCSKCGCKVKIE